MISAERLQQIAAWSRPLGEAELAKVRAGLSERLVPAGATICRQGEQFEPWAGVISGLVKLRTLSREGKEVTLSGVHGGGWFGEGSVIKHEPRRYDLIALRDTRLALLDRATFLWLFEHSAAFNRFLIGQLNERLGQFMALLENDRKLDTTARVARDIASMFNPVLYPEVGRHLKITQEELGLLVGLSRPTTNQALKALEGRGLLRVEHGGITVLDLAGLRRCGE
ncbi:MAG TPA: Crp/Fnr family transcriptional regulator [Burkholderiaceae bacterium]|nr:Crp/Fnr family transcriptional regulator [Burkholderiaceae bacterium]